MRSRRRLAAALSLLALQPAIALAFYLAGNGVTRSALALASVPLALVTAAVWASGRALRSAPAVLAALLALDGVYVADRCVRTETGRSGIRLCEMRDCTSEARFALKRNLSMKDWMCARRRSCASPALARQRIFSARVRSYVS